MSDFEAICKLCPDAFSTPVRSSAFPGLTRYIEFCEEFFSLHGLRATKLSGLAFACTMGFGLVIGEPSPEVAPWPLFWQALCFPIGSERKSLKWLQENIEKLIMFNKQRIWFHSSRKKLPLVRMAASWFLVSMYLIWIWVSRFNSIKQPLNCNSVGSRHVSHRRTSSFDTHLDDSFIVFKNVQLTLTLRRRMCVSGYVIHIRQLINLLFFFFFLNSWCLGFGVLSCTSFPDAIMVWVWQCCWLNVIPQLWISRVREQVTHPCVIQHPAKWFQTL